MEARDLILALLRFGLNQSAIAEKTGIAQPTISKVARGEVQDVMSRNYRKLLELHAAEAAKSHRVEAA
jgi:predicted transcriptional regulator